MNDILKTYKEQFRENRHMLRRYTAFVLALAMITTLFVNWQLHGIGISMTAQYQCHEVEHTHTADCYDKVLICGYTEGELENADEIAAAEAAAGSAQSSAEDEIMPLELEPQIEFVPHEHTADCYIEVQTLTCMEEEHTHGDDCFDPEDGTLICEKYEHTHDASCYTTEYELACGLEEGELVEQVVEPTQTAELVAMAVAEPVALEPVVNTVEPIYHHHTDACYEKVLTCPLPEHHHTVACLSDTSADLETPEEWQAANADAVITGEWNKDLLSVAKTQLGYEQSEKNFEIDPADGVTLHYYSRYGQSYGNPYGEWDVMFLSYCLKYAEIPQSAIPQEASVLALRSSMSGMDWLLQEDGSAAQPGDIVIYNKYVTRTVAVDSSADGADPDLDDLFSVDTADTSFSMDAAFENGAELEDSDASALDAAPSTALQDTAAAPSTGTQDSVIAPSAGTQDTVLTPSIVDPEPEQPAEKPVYSAGTAASSTATSAPSTVASAPSTVTSASSTVSSASGADTLAPSVGSPAAEPQTTTVTDALPVETVGIVSEVDEDAGTLTVISGDVNGKVDEVTLLNAEVLGVVDVAAAQYADKYGSQLPTISASRPNRVPALTAGAKTYLDYFEETPKGEITSTGMEKGGITNYSFKIDNTEQTGDFTVKADQSVYFTFDYQIAGGVLKKEEGSNILTYKLPDALCPKAETHTPIKDRSGNEVGTQYFNMNGTTTLVFDITSPHFNPAETFSGQFSYDWTYSKESATENKTFHFPGSSTEITLEKYQDIKIEKSLPSDNDGTIQETSDGKTKISYTVKVSSEHGWDEKVQIWDGLKVENGDIKAEYDSKSFKLTKYKPGGTPETVSCTPVFDQNTDSKYSGYQTTFQIEGLDELKAGEYYELTYDVLTTRTDYSKLTNTATTDNGKKESTRTIELHKLITKEQGAYDSANNCIDWIVTVKNPTGSDLNGYTVTDTLDNGATIKGNVELYVQLEHDGYTWSNHNIDTVNGSAGNSTFSYTFPAGSDAKLYQFKYQTTLPAGVTSVKNTAEYSKEPGGNKFTDEKTFNPSGGGQGGQSFSPQKTASGKLAPKDADHPNLLAAPWTITAAIPGKGEYTIKDNIGSCWNSNGKNIHYGIAKDLQKQIEQSLTLTYTNGGQEYTLNYNAIKQRPDISVNVTYYPNEWYSGTEISSTDDTTQVRSFKIELDTTNCTLDLSQLTLKYSTQVDISDLSEGDRITISNQLDGGSSVSYNYQKPSTGLKMSKGVKMVNKTDPVTNIIYWCGAPDHTLTPDYSEFQNKVLQYQILLDFSSVSDTLPATITLTDTLPKGLTYRTTNDPSAVIVFTNGYKSGTPQYTGLSLKDGTGTMNIQDYFKDNRSKLVVNTPAEGSEDGQTITFHIDGLDKLDFAKLKAAGFTDLVLCYQAELTDPRWSNVKFDEFLYTNKIEWKEEKKQSEVDVKVTQKVDVLKKEALQIKDKNDSRVKYTLTINPAAKDLDPNSTTVTLTDILTVQHASVQASLDIFSVKLYNADTKQEISKYEYSYTQPVLGKDGNGYPTYTTTFTLPDSTPLVLEYEYVTNATAKISLSNEAKVSGGSASVKDFELEKVSASSTVHQAKLTVYKVDKRNYSNALTGATFDLHRFNSSTGGWDRVQHEAAVDANGTLTFYFASTDGLQENTLYRLTEVTAPAGYSKASDPYYFIYQASGSDEAAAYNAAVNGHSGEEGIPAQNAANLLYCANGKASELFVPNTANSLTIIKHWRDKDNNTLTAAQAKLDEVEVYLYCYRTGADKSTATLYPHQNTVTLLKSKNWTATVPIADDYLNDYTFYIEEKDGNSARFTVVYDQPAGVTVGNTLTFTNTETENAGYELPSTGGSGTLPYTAAGGTMMLTALAYSFIRRKRRSEGRADD